MLVSPAQAIIIVYSIVFMMVCVGLFLDLTPYFQYTVPSDKDAESLGIEKGKNALT